jgi:hypothetical protein
MNQRPQPETVVRGSLLLLYPNGSVRRHKLPSAGNVKLGERSQISAVYDQRLYFFWFRRVKGGWEIDDSQPSMIYPRRLNAA